MSKQKLQMIKAVLGYVATSDSDLISRLTAVHDGMFNNPEFPTPPIDMTSFKSAIDSYSGSVAAALDGGKSVTALKNSRRAAVLLMLHQLGHYVEVACKGNLATFTSSGFVPVSSVRSPDQPTPTPEIASVDQFVSGKVEVTIKPVLKARHYELRSAAAPVAEAAVNWNTLTLSSTKPPTVFSNLTPGGTYTFQVRAYGKLGYSEWSAPVNRTCF
jgi:hypothetical protein